MIGRGDRFVDIERFFYISRQLQKREAMRIEERYRLADLERKIRHEYMNDKNRDSRIRYYEEWDRRISQAHEKGLEEDRQLWALRKRVDDWNQHYGFSKKIRKKAVLSS